MISLMYWYPKQDPKILNIDQTNGWDSLYKNNCKKTFRNKPSHKIILLLKTRVEITQSLPRTSDKSGKMPQLQVRFWPLKRRGPPGPGGIFSKFNSRTKVSRKNNSEYWSLLPRRRPKEPLDWWWYCCHVFKPVLLDKVFEIVTCAQRTTVRHNLIWNPISCHMCLQFPYDSGSLQVIQPVDLKEAGKIIYGHHVTLVV